MGLCSLVDIFVSLFATLPPHYLDLIIVEPTASVIVASLERLVNAFIPTVITSPSGGWQKREMEVRMELK